jgi:hypothetical protein
MHSLHALCAPIYLFLNRVRNGMTALVNFQSLSDEFDNLDNIRRCTIEEEIHVSVYDLLKEFGASSCASRAWKSFLVDYPEMKCKVKAFCFEGRGGWDEGTPVVNARTALEVICRLKGKKALKWSAASASALLAMMKPTEEDFEQMYDRLHEIQCGLSAEHATESHKSLKKRSPISSTNQTAYVRVCLPQEHCVQHSSERTSDNVVILTPDLIKFGITMSEVDRNSKYGPDNGYYLYSFGCQELHHAELHEKILRKDLRGITKHNTFEYVGTSQAAEMMGLQHDGSYESYIRVARTLFVAFVQRIKQQWPSVYRHQYGMQYKVRFSMDATTSSRRPLNEEMASKMGFADYAEFMTDETRAMQLLPPPDQAGSLETSSNGASTSSPDIASAPSARGGRTSTSGPLTPLEMSGANLRVIAAATGPCPVHPPNHQIICRNIVTGKEFSFLDKSEASRELGQSKITLGRTIIDQRKYLNGLHIRTKGQAHFDPPDGWTFLTEGYEKQTKEGCPVCSLNEDGTVHRVYESVTSAEKLVANLKRKSLKDHLDGNTRGTYLGRTWSYLKGDAHKPSFDHAERVNERIYPIAKPPPKRVISRNILNGEEIYHESVEDVVAWLTDDICENKGEKEKNVVLAIEQSNQVYGFIYRYADTPHRWAPSECYVFNINCPGSNHVACESLDGQLLHIFESAEAAAVHESERLGKDVDRTTIYNNLGKSRDVDGRCWRRATEDETHTFVLIGGDDDDDQDKGVLIRCAHHDESIARSVDLSKLKGVKGRVRARNLLTGQIREFASAHEADTKLVGGKSPNNFRFNIVGKGATCVFVDILLC